MGAVISFLAANQDVVLPVLALLTGHLNAKYQWLPKILTAAATTANPDLVVKTETAAAPSTAAAPTPTGQTPNDFILTRLTALEARVVNLESKVLIVK